VTYGFDRLLMTESQSRLNEEDIPVMKRSLFGFIIVMILVLLFGCSEQPTPGGTDQDFDDIVAFADETSPERKIIYEVDIAFDVRDLETASDTLDGLLEADEWFDREVIMASYRSYVIRVKTERLDAFVEALQDAFTLRSFSKVGTDISLQYQDTTNAILSLEAQLARLLELYEQATLAEMIIINEQMSDVEVELASLQGTLNQFDSLAEYSEVTLSFYGSSVLTKSPFFNRLGNAFVDGFEGLLAFFDGLFIVLATVFPFLVIFVGAGVGIGLVLKKRKAKKRLAKQRESEPK